MKTITTFITVFTALTLITSEVQAANGYFESDPFAFALGGYSLHVGSSAGPMRAQIGLFGVDVPAAMVDNPAYQVRMDGYGLKLDYVGNSPSGGFIGAELSRTTMGYTHVNSGESFQHTALLADVRVGYRYDINQRFFLAP